MTVYIISTDYLKTHTVIDLNVDDNYLKRAILDAQQFHIRRLLGSNLYDTIITKIENSQLTGHYQTLVDDYVADTLLYYSFHEAITWLLYKVENKSVVKKNSENSSPIELNELSLLREDISNKAEYYAEKTIKYLCANSSLFPEYLSGTNSLDDVAPDKNVQYDSGMYLRNGKRRWDIYS